VREMGRWEGLPYYRDDDTICEIDYTFAETCRLIVMTNSVLG